MTGYSPVLRLHCSHLTEYRDSHISAPNNTGHKPALLTADKILLTYMCMYMYINYITREGVWESVPQDLQRSVVWSFITCTCRFLNCVLSKSQSSDQHSAGIHAGGSVQQGPCGPIQCTQLHSLASNPGNSLKNSPGGNTEYHKHAIDSPHNTNSLTRSCADFSFGMGCLLSMALSGKAFQIL